MLWHVRALLEDRPGSLAAIATSCGDQNVNVLGLEIFPTVDGRVVDALVLHSPGGWEARDVEQLCLLAGATTATAVGCSPHVLEDQPVRWVRAAATVTEDPERLQGQLARLLEAFPDDGVPGLEMLALDDGDGPTVRLTRRVPFTDAEVARAVELRRVATEAMPGRDAMGTARAASTGSTGSTGSAATVGATVTVRHGSAADVDAVVAMHERCSADTLRRRYHAPTPRVAASLALSLLEPTGGTSLVLVAGEDVVGIGMVAAGPDGPELGLMVEDRWQRQGHGTRLLRALAVEAASHGADEITCAVLPDNEAVLRTIRRSGLRALVSYSDGFTQYGVIQYRVLVARLAGRSMQRRRSNRPAMGEITTPLVSLLHERSELRDVYRPAAAIDQAVRGGA